MSVRALPRLLVFAATALAAVAASGLGAQSGLGAHDAQALCVAVQEEGRWRNVDAATRGMTRIELRSCLPVTTCDGDVCTTTHDVGWSMRVFGKCHPTDCAWGRIPARRLANGKVYGVYNHGFAKRYVWARMSGGRPGQLWVFYRVDFVDPARADYSAHEYFRRVP